MNDLINVVTNYMAGSFASTFIFGILTGWLIEWLFYNFFWKNRKNSNQTEKAIDKTQEPVGDNLKKTEVLGQETETSNNKQTTEPEITKSKDKPVKKETVEKQKEEPKEQATETDVVEPEQQKKIAKPTKPDDLTKLLGIGPSMSKRLQEAGINSFKQLSESSAEALVEKLIAKGARINNKGIMESWANQAKLADANDFDGLKALQNKLKK